MQKCSIRTAGRSLFLSLTAITILALGQSSARADEVTISGSATGTVTGIPQLTFTGNPNFSVTTTMGAGSLLSVNGLGTFILSIAPPQSVAGSFTLNVTFTAPAGIVGGQSRSFDATIAGRLSPFPGFEGILIDFDNTPVLFTFNDGVNSGSFTFALADLFLPSGQGGSVTARITGSQTPVPEPATLFLLGTGLIGVVAGAQGRKSSRNELKRGVKKHRSSRSFRGR